MNNAGNDTPHSEKNGLHPFADLLELVVHMLGILIHLLTKLMKNTHPN